MSLFSFGKTIAKAAGAAVVAVMLSLPLAKTADAKVVAHIDISSQRMQVTVNGRQLTADGSDVSYSANGLSLQFSLGTSLDAATGRLICGRCWACARPPTPMPVNSIRPRHPARCRARASGARLHPE